MDDYSMYSFKILQCPRRYVHDWSKCPYAHKGEVAARRDPRKTLYWPEPCPDASKNPAKCPRGRNCPFSHSVFEYWLHPARYRTQICSIGANCKRTVCFFAHNVDELRTPTYPPMPMHLYKLAGTQPPDATAAPMDPSMQQLIAEAATFAAQSTAACGTYGLQQHQQQQSQHGHVSQWPQEISIAAAAAAAGASAPMAGTAVFPGGATTPAYPLQLVNHVIHANLEGFVAVPGMQHAYTDPTIPATESIAGSSANSLTPLSPVTSLRSQSLDTASGSAVGYQWLAQPGSAALTGVANAGAVISMGMSSPQQLLLMPIPGHQQVMRLVPQQHHHQQQQQQLGHPQSSHQHHHHQQHQQMQIPMVQYSGPLQQQQGLGTAGVTTGASFVFTDAAGYMQSSNMRAPAMPKPSSIVQSADGSCYILQKVPGMLPPVQAQGVQATASDVAQQLAQLQLQTAIPVQPGRAVSLPVASAVEVAVYQQLPVALVSQGLAGTEGQVAFQDY